MWEVKKVSFEVNENCYQNPQLVKTQRITKSAVLNIYYNKIYTSMAQRTLWKKSMRF